MALTEKMLEKVREQLSHRGCQASKVSTEDVVRVYLDEGSIQKASERLGCSYATVRRHLFRAIGRPGYGER